jgi:hypothetical protein
MGSLTLADLIIIPVSRRGSLQQHEAQLLVFGGTEGFVSASEMMLLKVSILSSKPFKSMSY